MDKHPHIAVIHQVESTRIGLLDELLPLWTKIFYAKHNRLLIGKGLKLGSTVYSPNGSGGLTVWNGFAVRVFFNIDRGYLKVGTRSRSLIEKQGFTPLRSHKFKCGKTKREGLFVATHPDTDIANILEAIEIPKLPADIGQRKSHLYPSIGL